MKKFLATALIALIAGYGGSLLAQRRNTTEQATSSNTVFQDVLKRGEIRCGYFIWPPYISKDEKTGEFSGINVDYVNAIAAELDLKVSWAAEIGVGDAVAALNSNKVDMMCGSLWPDGPRSKFLTLSTPTMYAAAYVASRADDNRFDGNLDKINDPAITIPVIDGDVSYKIAQSLFPKARLYTLPQTAASSDLFEAVKSGRADVMINDRGTIDQFMQANPGVLKYTPDVPPAQYFPEVLAMRQGEYDFKAAVDIAIRHLNDNDFGVKAIRKYNSDGWFTTAIDTRSVK